MAIIITIRNSVKVFLKLLHNHRLSALRLLDGKVAIFIDTQPYLFNNLTYTTSVVSVLPRALCVAFLILEVCCGNMFSFMGSKRWFLGKTGCGPGLVDLADAVLLRARFLLINQLTFEMKRKVRSEFITSGLTISQDQIERLFAGVDQLIRDYGEGRIEHSR